MTHRHHHIAVVGAGIAGLACARTLVQAGAQVTLFEKSRSAGGRMASRDTAFGSFDHGAQYFTLRDPRFGAALATVPGLCKPWSANTVRVLDERGRLLAAGLPARELHWVATPDMNALPRAWAAPLLQQQRVQLETRVLALERDTLAPTRWQLRANGPGASHQVFSGFDAVLLALPAGQARDLLQASPASGALAQRLGRVEVAPCWTLMLAFPQALQPGLSTLGPQWNAARSTHHRIAWLARESSKPARAPVERWTVQASAQWSQEHLEDDAPRVQAKLHKAFAEVTGIHAEPAHVQVHRWLHAQTIRPLGRSHLWQRSSGVGLCGDWCLGHRVEDAFVSGLALALAVLA